MRNAPRLLLPLFGLLVAVPAHRAEAQSISFGVLAGASLSTFTGDVATDIKQNAGFIVGGFVRLSAMGFAVQPGLYYTAKGAKTSDFSEATGEGSKTSLDYIQIPIVIRLHLGPLYVGAGPAIGIKLSCMNTVGSATATDCASAEGAKSTEISGIAEAGIEMGKLSLGLRGDLGLTNAMEAVQSGNASNVGVKTRTVSAVVMYRF
jgi:hypothetical protein